MQGASAASGGAAGVIAALAAAASMVGFKSLSTRLVAHDVSWFTPRIQRVATVSTVWIGFVAAYLVAT